MKNILIINAHQKYEGLAEGKLNQAFFDVAYMAEYTYKDHCIR